MTKPNSLPGYRAEEIDGKAVVTPVEVFEYTLEAQVLSVDRSTGTITLKLGSVPLPDCGQYVTLEFCREVVGA